MALGRLAYKVGARQASRTSQAGLADLLGVAVAQRRLGPSSSATTSTTDRVLPSSAVHARCWSRPTTTTRLPLDSDCAACSAWSRHTITAYNDASCSRRPDAATQSTAPGYPALGLGVEDLGSRSSW